MSSTWHQRWMTQFCIRSSRHEPLLWSLLPLCTSSSGPPHVQMQAFGPIENTRIMRDSMTKISRGFGFVTFMNNNSAVAAAQNMNGWPLFSRRLFVTMSKPVNNHGPIRSLNGAIPWASNPSNHGSSSASEAPMPANRAFFQVNPVRKSLSLMGAV